MLNEDIKLRPGSARKARALLRRRLADLGVDGDHILSVELVVAELVAAALEQEGDVEHRSGHLSLELFPLLTSVRLRHDDSESRRAWPRRAAIRIGGARQCIMRACCS